MLFIVIVKAGVVAPLLTAKSAAVFSTHAWGVAWPVSLVLHKLLSHVPFMFPVYGFAPVVPWGSQVVSVANASPAIKQLAQVTNDEMVITERLVNFFTD